MEDIGIKFNSLKRNLERLQSAAVAFSGGTDSAFLLKAAHDALGNNAVAVTARSIGFPERELKEAEAFTKEHGIEHIVFEPDEMSIKGFSKNPENRCYLCKKELMVRIKEIAQGRGIETVAEGSNADDDGDYRPGIRAVREIGVISPLREAGLKKDEIRMLSKEMGLKTWNKPAFACLLSRIPYGEEISPEKLRMVDKSEQLLLDMGLSQVRVRCHGNLARIETDEEGFIKLADEKTRREIGRRFRQIGFVYTAIDISGYRTGSMNEALHMKKGRID